MFVLNYHTDHTNQQEKKLEIKYAFFAYKELGIKALLNTYPQHYDFIMSVKDYTLDSFLEKVDLLEVY